MGDFSTFVISETSVEQINALPEEMQLKYYKAVTNYGLHGIEPEFTGMELAVWISMRDLIFHTKRKDAKWREKQQKNGKKGGRPKTQYNPENPSEPKETQYNPEKTNETQCEVENVWVNDKTHNVNDNDNVNDNEFSESNISTADSQSFPTADAVELKAIIQTSRSPPKPKRANKLELTEDQKSLFHAAKACFETSEKAKALMYQDDETTAREMKNLKILAVRCTKMAPGVSADFLQDVLEHFRVMTNGKYKGKFAFTPRALTTQWIWELVIDSLPENNVTPELRECIRGLFK